MGKPFLFPCDLASQGCGEGRGETVAWRDGDRRGLLRERCSWFPVGSPLSKSSPAMVLVCLLKTVNTLRTMTRSTFLHLNRGCSSKLAHSGSNVHHVQDRHPVNTTDCGKNDRPRGDFYHWLQKEWQTQGWFLPMRPSDLVLERLSRDIFVTWLVSEWSPFFLFS